METTARSSIQERKIRVVFLPSNGSSGPLPGSSNSPLGSSMTPAQNVVNGTVCLPCSTIASRKANIHDSTKIMRHPSVILRFTAPLLQKQSLRKLAPLLELRRAQLRFKIRVPATTLMQAILATLPSTLPIPTKSLPFRLWQAVWQIPSLPRAKT